MSLFALVVAAISFATVNPPAATAPSAQAPNERLIQIGIVPRTDQLDFVPEGRYTVVDLEGKIHELTPNRTYTFIAQDGGLTLIDWTLPGEVRLAPDKVWADVKIGERRYHGTLIVRANSDDTVTAIEELGIEEYLLGVLPLEMDPGWPLEALKAQAVVARTFAYTQLGKYRNKGFDLTSDTRSQVYGGLTDDSPNVRKAVEQTRGEVLGYKGEILNVFYHSCCGGHTADEGTVWKLPGPTPKPLRGVRDNYCAVSPHYRWKVFIGYDRLLAALERKHLIGGKLRRFEIGARSTAGWVKTFIAKIGDQTLQVRANDLRLAIGASDLRSARIGRIIKERSGVEFVGAGSGHGVGLCQWGTKIQAQRGRRYEQILKFYFPGSTLSVIDE